MTSNRDLIGVCLRRARGWGEHGLFLQADRP